MIRFELYADKGGKWRWRAKARNGRIVAASGESFASKSNAKASAWSFAQWIELGEWKVVDGG